MRGTKANSNIEIVSHSFLDTWECLVGNKQNVLAQTSKDHTVFLEELVDILEAIKDVEVYYHYS